MKLPLKSTLTNALMLCTALFIFSCNSNEYDAIIENPTLAKAEQLAEPQAEVMDMEAFIELVTNLEPEMADDNVFFITYMHDATSNMVEVLSIEETEPGALGDLTESSVVTKAAGQTYTVKCKFKRRKDNWKETSDTAAGAVELVQDCLYEGGCASVCQNSMVYEPQTNTISALNQLQVNQ